MRHWYCGWHNNRTNIFCKTRILAVLATRRTAFCSFSTSTERHDDDWLHITAKLYTRRLLCRCLSLCLSFSGLYGSFLLLLHWLWLISLFCFCFSGTNRTVQTYWNIQGERGRRRWRGRWDCQHCHVTLLISRRYFSLHCISFIL